jgi:hypothetical protein
MGVLLVCRSSGLVVPKLYFVAFGYIKSSQRLQNSSAKQNVSQNIVA